MNTIITIAREYGSGGRIIAHKLAEQLGYEFYDEELIEMAANKIGFSEEYVKENEEQKNFSFLSNFYSIPGELPVSDQIFIAESNAIREAAEKSNCIIVGRCACFILRDRPNVVRVFMHAPKAYRLEQAAKMKSLPPKELEKFVDKTNRQRREYSEFYTGEKWDDAHNYDLCLDASKLGYEKCVQIIKGYMKVRFDGLEF